MAAFRPPWSLSVFGLMESCGPQHIYSSSPRHFLRWTHDIEERILLMNCRSNLYVGFQRLSAYMPQRQRYKALSKVAASVFLFAIPDCLERLPEGVELAALTSTHELAREWFILVNHPRYARLFVARQLPSRPDEEPRWSGVLSTDKDVISHVEICLRHYLVREMDLATAGRG